MTTEHISSEDDGSCQPVTEHDNRYCADSHSEEPEGYYWGCHDGTYYGPCSSDCCYGQCESYGPCPCCCHAWTYA